MVTLLYWMLGWCGFGLLMGVVYVFFFHHGPKDMWDFQVYKYQYMCEKTKGKHNHIYNHALKELDNINEKRGKSSDFRLAVPLMLKCILWWPVLLLFIWGDYQWDKVFKAEQQ